MVQNIILFAVILAAVFLFVYLLRRQTRDEACIGCPVQAACKTKHHSTECDDPRPPSTSGRIP